MLLFQSTVRPIALGCAVFSMLSSSVMRAGAAEVPVSAGVSEAARINYPRVFGVRPGSPFLFRVPVSGSRPVHISAKGLPDGLSLDSASGVVTGTIRNLEKKSHRVEFTAKNAHGTATQTIRFVVGDRICLTPPMGWNSWYVWSEPVSEAHFRAAADSFERHGLMGHGWSYINLDDCWQGTRGGKHNAIQPNEKFPDIKGAVGYLHSKGIKAGIYTVPMISSYAGFIGSTCTNAEGTYVGLPLEKRLQPGQIFGRSPNANTQFGYYRVGPHWFFDRDITQIAEWGFDLIKVDWHPNDIPTTERISREVRAQKRDIALSLSNNATFASAADYARLCEMWRTTGDIEDNWGAVSRIASAQERWAPFAGPGHWNDPDMLQIGRTNTANLSETTSRASHLTPEEQKSQFSLWCMQSAPLLVSCDLDRLSGTTLAMMTNDEVIAIDQDPLGKPAASLPAFGSLTILTKPLEDGSIAICLLNNSAQAVDTVVPWSNLGLDGPHILRDLWAGQTLHPSSAGLDATLAPHACLMLRTGGSPRTCAPPAPPAKPALPPSPAIQLHTLTPVKAVTGWGKITPGKNVTGEDLSVDGKIHASGIGVHANSELVYARNPQWKRFVAIAGIDRPGQRGPASVQAKVVSEDAAGKRTELASSPVLSGKHDVSWNFNVPLPDTCVRLVLIAGDAGDGNDSDHLDWVEAGFLP